LQRIFQNLIHLSFVDVNVTLDENNIINTEMHIKEAYNHQYLEFSSCHIVFCTNGIRTDKGNVIVGSFRKMILSMMTYRINVHTLKKETIL
jgi:hypothetical protein